MLARSAGRAVHPLLRARRAGAPGDAVARLHRAGCPSDAPPSSTSAASPTPTPTATRRCSASTCTSTRASGSRCSAPTAPARPRWCCTSTASSPPGPARSRSAGCRSRRPTCRRSAAGSASSSRTPTTSSSWAPCAPTSASARPTSASSGAELDRRVMTALEQVGMAEYADRPPHHLSFGQRRRVAVATVLAMEPEILVLDEPSSNLDPASRRELADILRSLDVTVLMVTHDLPYALELCPRSVVLSDGHRRGRRRDVRRAHRRRADAGPPAGAALRLRPAHRACRAATGSLLLRSHPAYSPTRRREPVSKRRSRPPSSARSRRPASVWPARSTSSSTARTPRRSSGARSADQGPLRRRQTGQPRTDNILKVVGGVVGVIVCSWSSAIRASALR